MKIKIPNNNLAERNYILDVLLSEFLGLKFDVVVDDFVSDWVFMFEGKELIIKDVLFSKYPKDLEYLKLENVPSKVEFAKNDFTIENDIPIIYGDHRLEVSANKVVCGVDIFASSFFMLTRWEEYVNKNRDKHNRFPAIDSFSLKNNFLHRPIVNEYVEMLFNMLDSLGIQQKRKVREFSFLPTHDVDAPLRYRNAYSVARAVGAELVKRRSLKGAFSVAWNSFFKNKDPFDTFDYLMDVSESVCIKSYFFFMGKGQTFYDNRYKSDDRFIESLIKKIKQRGHYIGMHPTYNAYNESEQFEKEKQELENNLHTPMNFGREHFLRFSVPDTWQIWEDNGMEWDSTLSYADKEGFRCGVCYDFSVFNILTRRKLKLREIPLTAMEGSFVTYQKDLTPDEIEKKIKDLIKTVRKYKGTFVFLWHNSSFNTEEWKNIQHIYERILKDTL